MSEIYGFLSYNCKGLREEGKREQIFKHVKNKNRVGITFLQETHSAQHDQLKWEAQWGKKSNIFLNHGESNARGSAILFNNMDFVVNKYVDDKEDTRGGRLQVMSIKATEFEKKLLLINIYNANYENEQIELFEKLELLLEAFGDFSDHAIVFGGDFNLIFDRTLDAIGGTPTLKTRSIAALITIMEKYDLVDVYRLRNPNAKRFTFRQARQGNSTLQRRLDFFLVSNVIQESVGKVDILNSLRSDHSPILFSIRETTENEKGPNYWKFNSSLLNDPDYNAKMAVNFASWATAYANEPPQLKWELVKYEVRKFTMDFSKKKAKNTREEVSKIEKIIKDYETNPIVNGTSETYSDAKNRYEEINNEKAVGSILRSRCSWYEDGEKSSKYFLNLEKNNAIQSSVRAIFDENDAELSQKQPILDRVRRFYSSLFDKKINNTRDVNMAFLSTLGLPTLSEDQKAFCETDFTSDDLYETVKSMQGGRSPGNDGLGKEFYIHFWSNVGGLLFNSFMEGKSRGVLSPSQRQAIIKLLAKKDRDKRYIENWRPISLLNVDTKILSKTIASKLKTVLPTLVKSDQTAYVPGRFIGESCRLISDVIEIADKLKLDGWLVTMDIQKAFDSVDHDFLFCTLENAGFGQSFLNWIKVLVKNQESCVHNAGTATSFFNLLRGCRQGDPISAYLFILVIEVFFQLVRSNSLIKGLQILGFEHKFTSYADDSSFFLSDLSSVRELLKTFELFSKYSGLLLNKSKCELAGIGAKKDATGESMSELKNVNLTTDSVKILGIHYSYNRDILLEQNYTSVVKKITKCLAMWKWRNLSIAGKVTIFKTLAISKVVYVAFLSTIPESILQKLSDIQKDFIWNGKRPKVAHKTLIASYEDGGLKSVDIVSKIKALRLSWISRLYSGSPHPWKLIPSKLLEEALSHKPFYPNMDYSPPSILPDFYKYVVQNWIIIADSDPVTPPTIQNQLLWNNSKIRVGNNPIKKHLEVDFVGDLYDSSGNILNWQDFSRIHSCPSGWFRYKQLVDAIPRAWRSIINENEENKQSFIESNGTNREQHLLSITRVIGLEKLSSKLVYTQFLNKEKQKATSETTISNKFSSIEFNWPQIHLSARCSTIDSYTRMFHFKCTHSILYLNKALTRMRLADSELCSFCSAHKETVQHLFFECPKTKDLWSQIQNRLALLALPDITAESAFIGLPFGIPPLIQHLHLAFRICLYKSREKKVCNIQYFINKVKQIRKIETCITFSNPRKRLANHRKWSSLPEQF